MLPHLFLLGLRSADLARQSFRQKERSDLCMLGKGECLTLALRSHAHRADRKVTGVLSLDRSVLKSRS